MAARAIAVQRPTHRYRQAEAVHGLMDGVRKPLPQIPTSTPTAGAHLVVFEAHLLVLKSYSSCSEINTHGQYANVEKCNGMQPTPSPFAGRHNQSSCKVEVHTWAVQE
ncbi:unnamed protein product [Cylicocyclus nassatus]|uniref:Uncharacterized protein n=1 Tax=Cylicocyclus nassatus TaxID=53992 RepID=A0AA36M401_CYLNA|nr:unnamed protein product [Cylicocyclus nassatus]